MNKMNNNSNNNSTRSNVNDQNSPPNSNNVKSNGSDPNQRTVFFIDTSNPEIANQVISTSSGHPFIKPPFPPLIDARELIVKQNGKLPTRSPNAFIIYRKVFLDTAQANGYNLPMTVISAMVSKSWENEPQYVKDEYKKLSKEAYNRLNEMNPKSTKPNKRERWNFVSFDRKKSKSRFDKNVKQPENKNVNGKSNKISSPTVLFVENDVEDVNSIINAADWPTFYDFYNFNDDNDNNNTLPLLSFSPLSTISTNSSPALSSDLELSLNNNNNNDDDSDIVNDLLIQNMLNSSSFTPNLDNSQDILSQYLNLLDQNMSLSVITSSDTNSNYSSPDIDNLFDPSVRPSSELEIFSYINNNNILNDNDLGDFQQYINIYQQQQQEQQLQYDFPSSSLFDESGLGISYNFDNKNSDDSSFIN